MPRWLAVGYYAPSTPMGWLLFISLCIALLALKYGVNRMYRSRRAAKLGVLMKDSAAFSNLWPGERLFYAPHSELAAEANRSQEVITLLQQQGPPSKAERATFNSQVAAVERWLATVHGAMNNAAARERWPHQSSG